LLCREGLPRVCVFDSSICSIFNEEELNKSFESACSEDFEEGEKHIDS